MKSVILVTAIIFVLGGSPVTVSADEPPPLPTLVPSGVITDQVYQLQEFHQVQAYHIQHTTAYTATVGGATWAIECRFTYGEAGIIIMLMAVVVVMAFDLVHKIVLGGRS
ncbi:MAG: hypothetical protein GY832_46625 [Chloroflexi bacterium]|nr:hypothetical protein [Chloroflexota bacterium]